MAKGAAFLSVLAVVLGAVSGCSDPPAPRSLPSYCDGVCVAVNRCNSTVSRSSCDQQCLADPRNGSINALRPEAAVVVGDCISRLDCDTLFNGTTAACWDRARAETPPSAHLIDFCPGYSTYAFECGYWFPVEDCETKLNIWTDSFLDALTACTQEPTCDATDACLKQEFGGS